MKMNLKTVAGSPQPAVRSRQSGACLPATVLCPPASERGIALVITLILLSVTLFMAIAFLAISRRERGSVITETDTVTARLAADSALANAEAQIIATVLQTTNPYNFNLAVSTNYQNVIGYTPGFQNPANVNYDYRNDGSPLNAADHLQNVANLLFSPRAPVFVITNRATGASEFRFYLDLNHNARFDPNGLVTNVDKLGFTNGFIQETGDPEWIGVLERPGAPHGPNNKFLSRYAFIAMPVGNTLDLNAIHNQALHGNTSTVVNPPPAGDTFLRNQGIGGWEMNLAAFLADLNTNEWNAVSSPYNYSQLFNRQNTGVAFDDARALLTYRYNNNYNSLASFSSLFPNYPSTGSPVDMFPFGGVMTNTAGPFYNYPLNNAWPGANNPNHYFELAADLFDTSKITPTNFVARLQQAGNGVSTYDRYTFYRLLSQLGTDSAPESGKLNVNYVNVDTSGTIVPNYQTNLVAWTPAQFFTNAADRMLRAYTTQWFQSNPSNYLATYYGITNYNYYYKDASGTHANNITGIGLTNVPFMGMTNEIPAFGVMEIPVFLNGQFVYQPAVQRVLQLAANIYDATTNNSFALGKDYPSVFRPLFEKKPPGNIFVTSYEIVASVNGTNDLRLSQPFDAARIATLPLTNVPPNDNIYGVPWIIGAKKGFPSFNEISMQNVVKITRKVKVTKSNPTTFAYTNVQYNFSVSNSIGIEFWNSYTNGFTNNGLRVVVSDYLTMNLTNDTGYSRLIPYSLSQNATFTTWPRSVWDQNTGLLNPSAASPFYVPIDANIGFVTNEIYQWGGIGGFASADAGWQTTFTDLLLPHFGLSTTNRMQAFILSTDTAGDSHVIDYVHFNGPDSHRDLNAEIQTSLKRSAYDNMWDTNLNAGGLPWEIISQMDVSRKNIAYDNTYWNSNNKNKTAAEIDGFFVFMGGSPRALPMTLGAGYTNIYLAIATNSSAQLPYTPTVTAAEYTSWQVNDPLVHYSVSDIVFSDPGMTGLQKYYKGENFQTLPNIGSLNDRYQPWGKVHSYTGSDNNAHNTAYRDPLVGQSDDWDFPTYKLPSVGWLGRVHRGTPWQTVYLKATNVVTTSGIGTWTSWTGNGSPFDAINAAPVQDRLLFDLFSTALNENATRGQLPINVAANDTGNSTAGLAAWSAVFSGVVVPTDLVGGYTNIQPAGVDVTNSPLGQLVQEINNMRTNFVNVDGVKGMFEHVGDILSVSALSQKSPFLVGQDFTNGVTDALMEWLPQQTLSLLRVGNQPRFVVYSYGQTLKPALNGVVTSGGAAYSGMITNYQVVAETVTRSVVRIEGAPTETHAVMESFTILPPD